MLLTAHQCFSRFFRHATPTHKTHIPCPKTITSQITVIKDFCKQVGVDNKQVQGVVRLAKKNGEWLGFLA